jgi:hypothetical protein
MPEGDVRIVEIEAVAGSYPPKFEGFEIFPVIKESVEAFKWIIISWTLETETKRVLANRGAISWRNVWITKS